MVVRGTSAPQISQAKSLKGGGGGLCNKIEPDVLRLATTTTKGMKQDLETMTFLLNFATTQRTYFLPLLTPCTHFH